MAIYATIFDLMTDELWLNGIRPMLWGLLGMAAYVAWLIYFYSRFEQRLSAWLGRHWSDLSIRLTHVGYEVEGGNRWFQRVCASFWANTLLLFLLGGPFLLIIMVWWVIFS